MDATEAKRVAIENNFMVGAWDGRFDEGEEEGGQSLTGTQSASIYSINMPPIAGEIAETPETILTPSLVPHACLARRVSQSFLTQKNDGFMIFIFIPCSSRGFSGLFAPSRPHIHVGERKRSVISILQAGPVVREWVLKTVPTVGFFVHWSKVFSLRTSGMNTYKICV